MKKLRVTLFNEDSEMLSTCDYEIPDSVDVSSRNTLLSVASELSERVNGLKAYGPILANRELLRVELRGMLKAAKEAEKIVDQADYQALRKLRDYVKNVGLATSGAMVACAEAELMRYDGLPLTQREVMKKYKIPEEDVDLDISE